MSLAYADIGRQSIIHKCSTQYHRQFTELVLTDATPDSALQMLASIIKRPVLLIDHSNHLIASTETKFLRLLGPPKHIKTLTGPIDLVLSQQSLHLQTTNKEECLTYVTLTSHHNGSPFYLGIKEDKTSFCLLDWMAIEACMTALALMHFKTLAVRETERKLKSTVVDSILRDLLNPNADHALLNERASSASWNPSAGHTFIVIDFDKKNLNLAHIYTLISSFFAHYTYYHLETSGHSTIKLLVLTAAVDQDTFSQAVSNMKESLQEQLKHLKIKIGISSEATSMRSLKNSYQEAHQAISFGKLLPKESSIIHYNDLGVYRFLCQYSSIDELITMVPAPLLHLHRYDQERRSAFIETLTVYFKHNSNAKQTAKELFIHYKTVQYRINRAKEIMGINFEDHQYRLEIEMGLRILPLIIKKI